MLLTGAQIVWETLLREGVDLVFGYPGGTIMPDLRRDAGLPGPPRAGAARGQRGRAHGRGLCPGHRQGRRVHGHLRARRHEPGDRPGRRHAGLVPMVAITGQVPPACSAPTPSRRPT